MTKYSSFTSPDGENEHFISISSERNSDFSECLESFYESYVSTLKEIGLTQDTQVFCRFYLSDIANQKEELLKSKIFKFSKKGAYSIIQQCPLDGGSISMLSYHIEGAKKKNVLKFNDNEWKNGISIQGGNYALHYTGNFISEGPVDSFKQTSDIFSDYNSFLKENRMSLLNNTVRTWIYLRDIDNNYSGMVEARKIFFNKNSLTKDTRYIASTGIEARLKEPSVLVSMDAISIYGLRPKQIVRMEAREHLNPTHEYGVTFERGTKIEFGDRSHLYISGTASIDKQGKILHAGDVKKQTERVIENITALLKPHGADLKDMLYFIVYIRNITEAKAVESILKREKLDSAPIIFAEGAVCRPGWLVEIEGKAIIKNKLEWPDFF